MFAANRKNFAQSNFSGQDFFQGRTIPHQVSKNYLPHFLAHPKGEIFLV